MQATLEPPARTPADDAPAVRRRLVDALRRDLIGPFPEDADLAEERLKELPSRWYLTGYLVPADEAPLGRDDDDDETIRELLGTTSPDDEDGDNTGGTGAGDDEAGSERPATRRRIRPTSLGLTVLVPVGTRRLTAVIDWGDYRAEPPIAETVLENDREASEEDRAAAETAQWVRVPQRRTVAIDFDPVLAGAPGWHRIPVPESAPLQRAGGGLVLSVHAVPTRRRRLEANDEEVLSVTVTVVNERPEVSSRRFPDVSYAFQVRLTLEAEAGFLPSQDLTGYGSDEEDLRLHDLHYRDVKSWGTGRNTSVFAELGEDGIVRRIRTDPMPEAEVEKVDQNEKLKEIGVPLSMDALAGRSGEGGESIRAALAPFPAAYAAFIARERGKLARFDALPRRRETAERLIDAQEEARRRIAEGIDLLASDARVRSAFVAMNEAVAGALSARDPRIRDPAWRPFQLAFILVNLSGLADRTHPDREIVDLLFFPTGGGKTEAYLGLSAFQIAHRRLAHPGFAGAGVTVIMRYTLRLLTLDQLSRAAGVVCALELMRRSDRWRDANGRKLLGDWPIEIGLWIGSKGSPNKLGGQRDSGPDRAYTRVNQHRRAPKKTPAPAPLRECPWCRAPINPTAFGFWPNHTAPARMTITCGNPECAFSGESPLPVIAVDEEIYDRLPAFLIATVDKFAQLPWREASGAFFGHVDRIVPENGDRNADPPYKGFRGADRPGEGHPFANGECLPPPDLVIQDELHLISGPLGTIAGLYETAIDALSTRTVNGKPVRPKIVASTATVRRAEGQIRQLFDRRRTAIFPPPGIDREDSWFAITRPAGEAPPRLYVGLAALGQGPRVVFLKALITLLAAAQAEHEADGGKGEASSVDPYLTAVCYFNALRELGGARRIVEDEVRAKIRAYGRSRRRLAPADAPFTDRTIGEPVELTSRVSTDEVATYKDRLAKGVGPKDFVDVALATNMISVGLDITRLGLMLVQGQPKSAAEYIQATSRVGRDEKRPGLVIAILDVHKPRDRAHYESFRAFHSQFYRSVEATSVTPWSTRAQDRALAAALVATIRHTYENLAPDPAAIAVSEDPSFGARVKLTILDRASRALKDPRKVAELEANIDALLTRWHDVAEERMETSGNLAYGEETRGSDGNLLHRPLDPDLKRIDGRLKAFTAAWSMRDVEPAVGLRVCMPNGQPLSS